MLPPPPGQTINLAAAAAGFFSRTCKLCVCVCHWVMASSVPLTNRRRDPVHPISDSSQIVQASWRKLSLSGPQVLVCLTPWLETSWAKPVVGYVRNMTKCVNLNSSKAPHFPATCVKCHMPESQPAISMGPPLVHTDLDWVSLRPHHLIARWHVKLSWKPATDSNSCRAQQIHS